MTTDYYGNYEEGEGHPLAAWLWGHRLREGQHWMEYLLEFLNLLVGFDYRLGQGVNGSEQSTYNRFTRLGLRRFVFYDEREKNRNPLDDRARQLLLKALEQKAINITNDPITLSRQLLRSYSAIEEKRSWYAKSLFPAHQNLLFWESLRKRSGVRGRGAMKQQDQDVAVLEPQALDVGLTFTDRNFFARGGEIYYLMLSAGTRTDPQRRTRITDNLRRLLTDRNQEIGDLAALIDNTWLELRQDAQNNNGSEIAESPLGWIPIPDCHFYQMVAEDVDNFLQVELDPLETLDLLAHLICFHVAEYIYHRAGVGTDFSVCATGACLDKRPCVLVDCLQGRDGGVIRQFSALLYKEQEQQQIQAACNYVLAQVQTWAARIKGSNLDSKLRTDAEKHFDVSSLHRKTLNDYEQQVAKLSKKFSKGKLERQEYLKSYADLLTSLLLEGFKKHFVGVHRKLARSIGLVAPRKGRHPRFVLEDTLLKALALANVLPGREMPYDEFLDRLYSRYGIVVGQPQARLAGLNDRQSINANYYESNRAALLTKMKNAGLLREYSDATSMVRAVNA